MPAWIAGIQVGTDASLGADLCVRPYTVISFLLSFRADGEKSFIR